MLFTSEGQRCEFTDRIRLFARPIVPILMLLIGLYMIVTTVHERGSATGMLGGVLFSIAMINITVAAADIKGRVSAFRLSLLTWNTSRKRQEPDRDAIERFLKELARQIRIAEGQVEVGWVGDDKKVKKLRRQFQVMFDSARTLCLIPSNAVYNHYYKDSISIGPATT